MRQRSDLRNYQRFMADRIVSQPAILLAAEMGTGKSAAVLTAARELLDEFVIRKVLIVAPLRVATETWPDEIAAWKHTRVLSYSVLVGSAAERARAARENTEIHIINRENLPWLWKHWGDRWPYDMVVWDESSGLKAWKKRTKLRAFTRFGAMAAARKLVHRVVLLTGTPAPNGLHDLGGQAYILDQGERLGRSRSAFESRWFDKDYMGYELTPKPNAEREIMGLLSDVMFGLKAEDYIELPPVISNIIPVRLPDKVMREYRDFERTMVSEAHNVEAVSRGVLTNKLLQFAQGAMYREDKSVVEIHDLKLDALERVVEEAAGQSLLVAYSYRFDLARIRKKYPRAVVFDESPNVVKDWNAGKIRIMLCHPASMGHGLNLQFGGHIACWYGLTWSLELYQQLNARLPRPGQKHHCVFIHHIVAQGTADEDVLAVLAKKDATQRAVHEAVAVRLRR
jgi:SNF2 family DNA or RNA helicase